jgi:hypothetical protein
MRAGPALPVRIRRPIAFTLSSSPWPRTTNRCREILTTSSTETSLLRSSRGLPSVRTSLSNNLVCGLLVGVAASRVGDAGVQGVELVAGAEVCVAAGVAGEVLPAGGDAGGRAAPGCAVVVAVGRAVVAVAAELGRGGDEGGCC